MSTSPSSAQSPSISKSEYYSSLPWFRRCLAMLNWRPVVDYELREIEFERRKIAYERSEREYEQRKIAHEQRMKQLRKGVVLTPARAIEQKLAPQAPRIRCR